MANKRIKDLETAITDFRAGDVIPVDGPSGTAKMDKDVLLEKNAENVWLLFGKPLENYAKISDGNSIDVELTIENEFKSVLQVPFLVVQGTTVVVEFTTTSWNTSSLPQQQAMLNITTRDGDSASTVVQQFAQVSASVGRVSDSYELKFNANANYLYILVRGNTGESVRFSIRGIPASYLMISDVKEISDNPNYNLFENGTLNTSTGEESSVANRIRSDFIEVFGEFDAGSYSPYEMCILFYDSNKKFIRSQNFVTNSHFNHVGYIRIRILVSSGSLSIDNFDINKIFFPLPRKRAFDLVNISNEYDANAFRSKDVWDLFDKLSVDYKGYCIERNLLTTEDSGLPIYYYKFGAGAKKIAIVSGQHGPLSDPRDSVITLYRFVRDVCENKFTPGSVLEKLKDECTLLVIPCLNPYGFDNYNENVDDENPTPGGRFNYNAVNLNRDWTSLTQPETQAASALLESYNPDIVVDLHCTGDFPRSGKSMVGKQSVSLANLDNTYDFADVLDSLHMKDYSIHVIPLTINNLQQTLTSKSVHSFGATASTTETNWFIDGLFSLHDEQIESANYSLLVNVIRCALSVVDNVEYSYERTARQLSC